MIANDILFSTPTPLAITVTAEAALAYMEEYGVKHLPVVRAGSYVGLVCDTELLSWHPQRTVGSAPLFAPFVLPESHLLEVLDAMGRYGVDLLPVATSVGEYRGVITYEAVIKGVGDMCQTSHRGATLLLSMDAADYSVGLLSRLAEENDTTILNLFSYLSPHDEGKLHVSIKVNREEATPYIRSLERFGYQVDTILQPVERVDETLLRHKIDELIHYIEM